MSEEKLREKYMELQMFEQAMQQIQQRKAILENQKTEFLALKENLEGISKLKKDSPMYSSVGSGVFIKSELKDPDNVLVNIGSGIALEKTVPESIRLVENQISELNKIEKHIEKELEDYSKKGAILNEEMAKLSAQHEHKH
ncbi:MAG: prefoldin subunit alpha [Nanoarchaeota archaeon]|nr:prefoldin subunit alpha [Nanoarchaeota archaeon]